MLEKNVNLSSCVFGIFLLFLYSIITCSGFIVFLGAQTLLVGLGILFQA